LSVCCTLPARTPASPDEREPELHARERAAFHRRPEAKQRAIDRERHEADQHDRDVHRAPGVVGPHAHVEAEQFADGQQNKWIAT
jgi:hypothetical protein